MYNIIDLLQFCDDVEFTCVLKKTNGTTIFEKGLPICGYCNAKPSEKDHDLSGMRILDLWISSQHT
jgi:hypothetical protein